jgi:undecaprenyl diphosphate synthase
MNVPRHIAFVMDGNGRWAEAQGLPRIEGHRRGAETVRMVSETCAQWGVEAITLYCLSSENWKRPAAELSFLMELLEQYLVEERETIMRQDMRLRVIGRRDRLPSGVIDQMQQTLKMSESNSGMQLVLAIDYGGRAEIANAAKELAGEVARGRIEIDQIDESAVARHLYTDGLPDPDLMVRTGGDYRVSNFLLWQISYAELWITDKCWPAFQRADLIAAVEDYAVRQRRFGGLLENS